MAVGWLKTINENSDRSGEERRGENAARNIIGEKYQRARAWRKWPSASAKLRGGISLYI